MPEQLKGEVQSIVFHNPESHYVVARIKAKSQPGRVTAVGNMGLLTPGEEVALSGEWKEHPKFGRQFQVESCVQNLPASINGIKRYLSSGLVKGIGPVFAQKLVDAFGHSVLDILDNDPDKLLQIEGIGKKKLERITKSWSEQREIRSLLLFLQTYAVPTTFAGRIYQHYGSGAVAKLQENPYDLAYEIRGVGFKTADRMALQLGFAPDCPERLEAAIVYALFQLGDQGHLFCPKEELLQLVHNTLEQVDEKALEDALKELQNKKRVLLTDLPEQGIYEAVFLTHFYRWETEISSRLSSLLEHPARMGADRLKGVIAGLEQESSIKLSEEQMQTISEACSNKVFIITGGPGTGKTTITRFIVSSLQEIGMKVKLAAPTGRASKRLSEATGFPASTIHRMLGFNPAGGFAYNEEKKLKTDLLIVDEASMLDCQLFLHLLRALPLPSRLILIGDVNQLPSVGAGNVLYDLLQSQVLPSKMLHEIYRQARESMIVVNAHRINLGDFPHNSHKDPPDADYFWVEMDDLQRVQELIVYMACERIPKVYGLETIRDVQILSPMHKGDVGTAELNSILQQKLNPKGTEIRSGNRVFRRGDRVLQMRNNYEKWIFNGDLGWIREIDLEEGELLVDFDEETVRYDRTELDELSLAYCISVHKSQGSEYPAVIIPVVSQHYILLQRNLIYTALTRARSLAVMIGSKKALAMGIKNQGSGRRYTNLRYQLKAAVAGNRPEN